MAEPLVIECSDKVAKLLDTIQETGLYGPTRETCAQRLLEAKLWDMCIIATYAKGAK